jgi:hypothetical protein
VGIGNETDYLNLPLDCVPSRRFEHGQPYEYRLVLAPEAVAMLRLVAGKGWALTIVRGPGRAPDDRGLFGTVFDAVMVLYAEFYPQAGETGGSTDQLAGNL